VLMKQDVPSPADRPGPSEGRELCRTQDSPGNGDLIFLVALFAIGLAALQLSMAASGHDIMRVQHLATAVQYARGHIDLMRPVIPGFNANGAPTPVEFPIWQGITAALMKLFGVWYGWGNVVSIVFLFSSMWALFDLTRRLFSKRAAWWTLLFCLTQPINVLIAPEAGGDGTAWAFALWFVYCAFRMMAGGGWRWWPAAALAGCLSATTKAPFFMTAGLTTFLWLLQSYRRSRSAWIGLVSAGAVSCAVFLAWNAYSHRVYAEAEFPLTNLNVFAQGGAKGVYFGDLAYRLKPSNWIYGCWHALTYVVGNFTLVFLLLAAVRLRRMWPVWSWLLAAGCATLVFTPTIMFRGHVQYFFIFSPVVALLCARAAEESEPHLWPALRAGPVWRSLLVFAAIFFGLVECSQVLHFNAFFDTYNDDVAQVLKQHTAPTDKLIVWGQVWGEPFMRAERQGLTGGFTLQDTAWLNNTNTLARLKELGYTKLALINASPLTVALTQVTGSHLSQTFDLPRFLPAVAKNWPVAFDSRSVLIVEIPK
jgi:4-amino-4-deoxy-L-arabinose transferase-like glycosyltransferase